MFILKDAFTFTRPVTVRVPVDDGVAEQRFEAEFSWRADAEAEGLSDRDALRRALVGWTGVADADGQPIPFGEAVRDRLIEVPFVRQALVEAFVAGLRADRGNG